MPNTKSAAKAMRGSARKRVVNQKVKDTLKKELKEVKKFITGGDQKGAAAKLSAVMSSLDKAAKKGVIKKNNASRRKSRIAKAIGKLGK